jgi:hypothetical protein
VVFAERPHESLTASYAVARFRTEVRLPLPSQPNATSRGECPSDSALAQRIARGSASAIDEAGRLRAAIGARHLD